MGRRRGDRGSGALRGPPGAQPHRRDERRRARPPRGQLRRPRRRARSAAGRLGPPTTSPTEPCGSSSTASVCGGTLAMTSIQVSHVAGVAKGLVLPDAASDEVDPAHRQSAATTPAFGLRARPLRRPSPPTPSACRRPFAPTASFAFPATSREQKADSQYRGSLLSNFPVHRLHLFEGYFGRRFPVFVSQLTIDSQAAEDRAPRSPSMSGRYSTTRSYFERLI
mmetsp:Transcript_25530/g.82623  ORF Transcript_25530/g.82623 Transcript_25530/m.82623 type:complete len:223 (-) Transcript_25530:537-1205(-)